MILTPFRYHSPDSRFAYRFLFLSPTTMQLETSKDFEQFGAIRIHEVQRVIELDAGSETSTPDRLAVSSKELLKVQSEMAIVILCKNEEARTIDWVLRGVPHDCLIVLVSNSTQDRYMTEVILLEEFCREVNHSAVSIHQKDPGAAKAFLASGASQLVADDDLIHNGKGEGMLMGMALTALTRQKYIGFIDADNYSAGSVLEYCKAYAAGFHFDRTQDVMIRIQWAYKPKIRNSQMVFERLGRSSRNMNEWLNTLLHHLTVHGIDIVQTGNAGEHAMTMALGMKLQLAGGFAVEPYEYIYMLERLSGLLEDGGVDNRAKSSLPVSPVAVYQIKTIDPHFHDNKGDEHTISMSAEGLSTLFHSRITPEVMKGAIRQWLVDNKVLTPEQTPPMGRIYPAVKDLDLSCLDKILSSNAPSLMAFVGSSPRPADRLLSEFL